MDKLNAMHHFIEVAKNQSFVEAANHLNVSAPGVTRSIAWLEARLGVKLFNRTTRHVRLTEAGARFLVDAKRILEEIDDIEASVAGIYSEPRGVLTITAPVLFGEMHIIPIVTEYLTLYPEVKVNTVFSDRVTSLVEEELDVAVRIGHLKDSNLYATPVGYVNRVVCAAPGYFEQHGKPKVPSDLEQHSIILPTSSESLSVWQFTQNDVRETVKLNPRLQCNQVGAALNAALNGHGITRLMSYQVGQKLEEGSLEAVLQGYDLPPLPVNLLKVDGRRVNAKLKTFMDLAASLLRNNKFINVSRGALGN